MPASQEMSSITSEEVIKAKLVLKKLAQADKAAGKKQSTAKSARRPRAKAADDVTTENVQQEEKKKRTIAIK